MIFALDLSLNSQSAGQPSLTLGRSRCLYICFLSPPLSSSPDPLLVSLALVPDMLSSFLVAIDLDQPNFFRFSSELGWAVLFLRSLFHSSHPSTIFEYGRLTLLTIYSSPTFFANRQLASFFGLFQISFLFFLELGPVAT